MSEVLNCQFQESKKIVQFDKVKQENNGEVLWPEKFPLDKILKIENTLGPYEFAALYQGEPITSEHQEFKQKWVKYRSWTEVEALDTRKFATIDPGGKEIEHDYTGIVRNYVDRQNKWNIKAIRVHFNAKELINYLFQLHDEGFEKIGIEETVYLQTLKPFLDDECSKRNKFPTIVPLKHYNTQKEVRIRGLIPRYSSRAIFHIEGECGDLEKEMFVFPKGANDDTIDAFAMQLEIAESPMDEYKQAVMRLQREERRESIKRNYAL